MVVSKTAIIESVNPSSKEVLGRAPIMTQSQVLEAVERSQKAFELWQLTSYKQRAKHLLNLRRVIAEHADQIATLISQEVGKPLAEAYLSELTGPLDTAVWLAENCEKLMVDQTVALSNPLLNSKQSLIAFEPLGVIGIIAPWNYPFRIPMLTAMMAIMRVLLRFIFLPQRLNTSSMEGPSRSITSMFMSPSAQQRCVRGIPRSLLASLLR